MCLFYIYFPGFRQIPSSSNLSVRTSYELYKVYACMHDKEGSRQGTTMHDFGQNIILFTIKFTEKVI